MKGRQHRTKIKVGEIYRYNTGYYNFEGWLYRSIIERGVPNPNCVIVQETEDYPIIYYKGRLITGVPAQWL